MNKTAKFTLHKHTPKDIWLDAKRDAETYLKSRAEQGHQKCDITEEDEFFDLEFPCLFITKPPINFLDFMKAEIFFDEIPGQNTFVVSYFDIFPKSFDNIGYIGCQATIDKSLQIFSNSINIHDEINSMTQRDGYE